MLKQSTSKTQVSLEYGVFRLGQGDLRYRQFFLKKKKKKKKRTYLNMTMGRDPTDEIFQKDIHIE